MTQTLDSLPSLDATGFSDHAWRPASRAQHWRFRRCAKERALYERVLSVFEPDDARRAKGLACGSHQVAYQHPRTGEIRLRGNYCESRTCPACTYTCKHQLSVRVGEWVRLYTSDNARLVTLTLRSSSDPLGDQLSRLQESFKKLRRHGLWRKAVKFGKAIIEVTYNERTAQWHPHLHVIAVGYYIEQQQLSKAWMTATGDSGVVDIRKIKDGQGTGSYLGEYLGKPPEIKNERLAVEILGEYYMAIRNRKMILSFGGAPPLPDLPKSEEAPDEKDGWVPLGSLDDLFLRADRGDEGAILILHLLESRSNPTIASGVG